MLILGMDTSGKTASVAVYDSERQVFLAESSIYTSLTHSQVIMPLCQDVLNRAGKSLDDIDSIAVANGPGSYTGLRIGIASVKAMSFGAECNVCGVSTLEALAYNNTVFQGIVCPVMKARGNLVYMAIYMFKNFICENIMNEKIMPSEELAEFLSFDAEKVLLCGDGAEDFIKQYKSDKFLLAPPDSRLQNACGVCLASVNKSFVSPEQLEVSYMQKVKAEKDLEKHSQNC